ncbi:DNA-directed RNA polymerase II subunit RPB7 [Populus alba x Populus x berolinensis]|nr:DNA-directed RNA polymerase II subunit RPB7 [Populus alba x Populus x berolinensis]
MKVEPGPRVTGPSVAGPHKLKQKRELANDAARGGTYSRLSSGQLSSAPVIKAEVRSSREEKRRMFFHIVLERNMQLHPRFFGRNLRENIVSKLMKDVEGTCRHWSTWICGIENIGKGLIRDGTGFVTFPVKYQCVVFRPFKGEILEAVVTMVNKMGFFAEAGPVQIFVSNHLIPDDMEFQTGDMPNYTTSDGSVKIQKDSEVRLKIIGTRVDATEIGLFNRGVGYYGVITSENQSTVKWENLWLGLVKFCIGTIKDDFLGVINDPANA